MSDQDSMSAKKMPCIVKPASTPAVMMLAAGQADHSVEKNASAT
jgi:hypothetical protein